MSRPQTRRSISVSRAFYQRLEAIEMPVLHEDIPAAEGGVARGPTRRHGRISRTGFIERCINRALDREGWPR